MRYILSVLGLVMLYGCANQPTGLTANQLESERYYVTERRRLPIDFPDVQRNLFRHEALCKEKYTFTLVPNQISYARVYYRQNPDDGWENTVLLSLTLLHNRSININAYSYYPDQMERVKKMITAIMMPENCGTSSDWENKIG